MKDPNPDSLNHSEQPTLDPEQPADAVANEASGATEPRPLPARSKGDARNAKPEPAQPAGARAPRGDTRNGGRFQRGRSGNPAGRPPGSRNRSSALAEALLQGEAEALTRAVIDMALLGKPIAMKLCLERLAPPRRERAIGLDLPPLGSIADVSAAMRETINAVAAGTVTPQEGETVIRMLAAHSEVIKTEDLERRVAAIEVKLEEKAAAGEDPALALVRPARRRLR